jgi:hypothetical protein
MSLRPCPACLRHIAASAETCPFCQGEGGRGPAKASAWLIAGVLAAGGCDDKPKNPAPSEPGAAPVKSAPPKKQAEPMREPADIYGPPPAMDEPAPKAVEPAPEVKAAEPKPDESKSEN